MLYVCIGDVMDVVLDHGNILHNTVLQLMLKAKGLYQYNVYYYVKCNG